MAQLSGREGDVYIGANVAGIKSWTLDYTVDVLDTTDFVDGGSSPYGRTFVPGLSTWAGSFEGFKDGAPQTLGYSATAVTLSLKEDGTTFWSGTAFITGIHSSVSVDGLVSYGYDFQGTGTLTVSTTG